MNKADALCTNCKERKVGNGAKGLCPNCYGYAKRHNGEMRPHRLSGDKAIKASAVKPSVRATQKKNEPAHILPRTAAIGGWVLDREALRRAANFLQLSHPIKIQRSQGRRRRGSAGWRDNMHVIRVSTYLSPTEINVTLWHELCHAAQREYEGVGYEPGSFAWRYAAANQAFGYQKNPYEVEARAAGAAFAHVALVH